MKQQRRVIKVYYHNFSVKDVAPIPSLLND